MAVTYTTAAERDAQPLKHRGASRPFVEPLEIALIVTSVFAAVLLITTYAGVTRVPRTETVGPVINLNTVPDAAKLEAALDPAFPLPADRRLAARELFAYLSEPDGSRRTLPNVGAIARARVAATAIDRTPSAAALRERLQEERSRAKSDGREPPASVPLLTGSQLSSVKPAFAVRDLATVRQALLIWVGLYVLGFQLVSMAWRLRGVSGDRLLLICAHVLTALGFAAMVSRPDPIRDWLLFVRYAEGVVAGLGLMAIASFINVRTSGLKALSYVPLAAAFILSILLLSPLGSGPSGSGAKVNLGPFQPIEAIRILLALFLAGYFARHWEVLRAVRGDRIGSMRLGYVAENQYVTEVTDFRLSGPMCALFSARIDSQASRKRAHSFAARGAARDSRAPIRGFGDQGFDD